MAINVLISCARKSKEKVLLKEWLVANPNIGHVYDCNDTPTDYNREASKQDDIDRHIREVTDWFIFLCPFEFVGKWTFHELQVAVDAKKSKTGLPMISLFFSKNPDKELNICNESLPDDEKIVKHPDDVSREQINQFLGNYYAPDEFEHGQIIERVEHELHTFLSNRLRLRRYETACSEVLPTDIFYDYNRTMPENGFDENVFRIRNHDKEMRDAGLDHILLCGAPASGKSRSVLEFIKRFGDAPDNRFITVRGAQNIAGSGVGHRCISLSKLVDELSAYDEYLDREDLYVDTQEKQRNFIVIDQIDSMLGEDLSQIEALFYHASSKRRPCYQIVLTTTTSGYEANSSVFQKMEQMVITTSDNVQNSHRLRTIHIGVVSYEDSKWVWDQFEDGSNPMPKGKVIGDYIPRLLSYNSRLIDEARQFHSEFSNDIIPVVSNGMNKTMIIRNIVAAFVRSVQLVRLMRHTGQLPLCLVVMVMKEELWQSIEEAKNSINGISHPEICYLSPEDIDFLKAFSVNVQTLLGTYFICNNIIAFSKEAPTRINYAVDDDDDFASIWSDIDDSNTEDIIKIADIALDFNMVREYDHEQMTTIVDPSIMMTIINDQVWDMLCSYSQYDFYTFVLANGRHTSNPLSRQEAKRAMKVWYGAFGKENPVNTMLRICTRSPMIYLDKLQNIQNKFGEDNNFSFVWNIFRKEMQKEKSANLEDQERVKKIKSHKDFTLLFRMLVARMGSVSKIRKEITRNDGSFKPIFLSYDMIAELYGQAVEEARSNGHFTPLPDNDYCVLARDLQQAVEQAGIKATEKEELYLHQRQLQLCRHYNQCKEYFETHNLNVSIRAIMDRPDDGSENNGRVRLGCGRIMHVMASIILGDEDFKDWLDKMISCGINVSFNSIKTIIKNSTRAEQNCRCQHLLFREILQKADEAVRSTQPDFPLKNLVRQHGVILISEMLQQVPSLLSAREILRTAIPWLEEHLVIFSSETREVWESMALVHCQKYEYNYLLKEIMNPNDGSIRNFWKQNTVLREKLLLCPPNFSDKWELYSKLYSNTDFDVSNYLFMHIFKDDDIKYATLEDSSVNRTYERFLKMLDDNGIRTMIERYIDTGDYLNQRLFYNVYDMVVTKRQENHFHQLLGEIAWKDFCQQEETCTLQIKKSRIYNVEQTLGILKDAVRRQIASNGLIDDSLFNASVLRWDEERKVTPQDPWVIQMKQYLYNLVADDSEYKRRLGKSESYYKSRRKLGYDEPWRQFHNKAQKVKRSFLWVDKEANEFKKELEVAMRKICERTILSVDDDDDLDNMFDKLEQLYDYPMVMPNSDSVLLLLRNRLPASIEKRGSREFRDLTPHEILLIAKYVYCDRGLYITTSVITGILEGFANYFCVRPETEKNNRETAWYDFNEFIGLYARFTYFGDVTYYQLLRVWPQKLNKFKGQINDVCQHSERLLNKAINIAKENNISIPPEWIAYYKDLMLIIGQR